MHLMNIWNSAIKILSWLILLALAGCGGTEAVVASAPTATMPLPTRTPTRVVQILSTPSPHPTTFTPTPTAPPLVLPTVLPTLRPAATPTPVEAGTIACLCNEACSCRPEHVVIISIDGLRPDAMEQSDAPTLAALRTRGAYSAAAQTVLPSVTLVGHASMLGGMSPEKHGIYWNVNAPELGKVKGPTLFSVAHEAGLSTAMIVGKPRLEHLVLPGSVDHYEHAGFTDRQVINSALKLIQSGLPDILFIHLPDIDTIGHSLGWMSPGQLIAVNKTDRLVGEVITALEVGDYLEQTLLIITADHGGSGFRHGSDSLEDVRIPWLAVGPGVPAGLILKRDIVTYDTAATVLYAFDLPIPEIWDGQPVLEIFQ